MRFQTTPTFLETVFSLTRRGEWGLLNPEINYKTCVPLWQAARARLFSPAAPPPGLNPSLGPRLFHLQHPPRPSLRHRQRTIASKARILMPQRRFDAPQPRLPSLTFRRLQTVHQRVVLKSCSKKRIPMQVLAMPCVEHLLK